MIVFNALIMVISFRKVLKFEGLAHIISRVVSMHMNKERTSPRDI